MPNEESSQRIKFAYKLQGWSFESGNQNILKRNADRVIPSEYQAEMEGSIFCPACFTNLIRVPKGKEYFSNGRDAHFAHLRKYKNIDCDLRTKRAEGKRYNSYEEVQRAIDNENLVIISEFLQKKPEPPENPAGEYDETPVEDLSGPDTEVPIGRHNGESFILPSKVSTVAGICRNFDENLYKYYHLPGRKDAVRLIDLLHNVVNITEEDDKPKLYYGKITRSYSAAKNPKPQNIRMIKLENHAAVLDFYLKATEEDSVRKGLNDQSIGRFVIMYGIVVGSGVGLAIERLKWGEFALLPKKYNKLLSL